MSRWFLVFLLVLLSASDTKLEKLASSGQINEDAPVKASVEITIHAPAGKVWQLLTDIQNWPKWQPDITNTEISGPLQSGTRFSWKNGGTQIRSRIALVRPYEQFGWTGTASVAKAIHVWKLQRLTNDETLVKTDESMQGFLLTVFYSSKKLEEGDQRWLDRLKQAEEK
jgi:uncharacterized protein YndB with AHSA1/START domain